MGAFVPALVLSLACVKSAAGGNHRITSLSEFSSFKNNVMSGTSYAGETVFLDTDLDLTGVTSEPIGNASKYFSGTFDGQGHVVKNFKIASSSLQYGGLFGNSYGLTIRNIVMGSSCSITSSVTGYSTVCLGGIIGQCSSKNSPCVIENSVNMASVTFDGELKSTSYYIGGIIGNFPYTSYSSHMKNCANYGTVTHSGSIKNTYIGGVAGSSEGGYSKFHFMQNCVNHGEIIHSGTSSSTLRLGGITGNSGKIYLKYCVNAGKITLSNTQPVRTYVGSIVGYVNSGTNVDHCYYTSELNKYASFNGGGSPSVSSYSSYDKASFRLNETVSVGNYAGDSLIEALNAAANYYALREYSHWLLNKNSKTVSFAINGKTSFTLNSQIILLPSLANEDILWFDGWYIDSGYASPLESFEATESMELYGKWEKNTKEYTISFDTRGRSNLEPITEKFLTNVTLPRELNEPNCEVKWWETEYGDKVEFNLLMPAHNIAFYVVWKCTHLESVDDFTSFKKIVDSGDSYIGTTVFLDTDLDFVGVAAEPIGVNSNYFEGTFDGQGHVISNFVTKSSSVQYFGLFGYSYRITIRNIVLDNSSSIVNSLGSTTQYIGGLIGEIYSVAQSVIENSVNMASVTFDGNAENLYLGGIAGYLSTSSQPIYIRNCANYGSVIHSGTSNTLIIGGIVGGVGQYNSIYKYVYNSVNLGEIIHSGTTNTQLDIGGIIGFSFCAFIENSVSVGKISFPSTPPPKCYVGSIVGYVDSGTNVDHCYYTSELDKYASFNGSGSPSVSSYSSYDKASFRLNETVSVGNYTGDSLIEALNFAADYYALREYSHWLLNKNNKAVSFAINGKTSFTLNSQIILLPSLANEDILWFDGWYTDNAYSIPFIGNGITENVNFYGKFENNTQEYIISFDTRGGPYLEPITAQFGSDIALPNELVKGDCNILSWETEYGDKVEFNLLMPSHNITLYVVWGCIHLGSLDDFSEFVNSVNNDGVTYSGFTVFLDTDLDFSGMPISPIGEDETNYFLGTFDGQGHVINGLEITSSLQYSGLFGYSGGLTIRNVVIGSSSSVSNSFKGSKDVFVGGFIGHCYKKIDHCRIENNVNLANVGFTGNTTSNLNLGGIIGHYTHSGSDYMFYVRNCANYGVISSSGVSKSTWIGGIMSGSTNTYGKYENYIQNCLNYGPMAYDGKTTNEFYLGGILGRSKYMHIENCVGAGEVVLANTSSIYNNTGGIVGYVSYNTYLDNCYYTTDMKVDKAYMTGSPMAESSSTLYPSLINSTLVSRLNSHLSEKGWNKWLLNLNRISVSFKGKDGTKAFSLDSKLILLPNLTSGWRNFSWFTDSMLETFFESTETSDKTELYGRWDKYFVVFDENGGRVPLSFSSKNFTYNDIYGDFPVGSKTGYSIYGWYTERNGGTKKEAIDNVTSDHTLYARWAINKHTVAFVSDGSIVKSDELDYGGIITYPANQTKIGHTFTGWDEYIYVVPDYNLTISAMFSVNNYTVSFETNGGSLCDPISQEYGSSIPFPCPAKTGYSFDCWCSDEGLKTKYESTTIPAEDIKLYAKWIPNNYTVMFDVNGGDELETNETIVVFGETYEDLPVPSKVGHSFDGWFTGIADGDKITSGMTVTIIEEITLYAHWTVKTYIVSFNAMGGTITHSEEETEVTYGETYDELPVPSKTGYSFVGWFTGKIDGDEVTSNTTVTIIGDQELYAHWVASKIVVTFDVNGGKELARKEITVAFNSTYGELPEPSRTGYDFSGWFTDMNESVSSDTIVSIPMDHVLHAEWKEITCNVEIVFETKDLSDEKIIEIVKQYTDAKFTIIKVEDDETGETKVIIKFTDVEKAEEFVRSVRTSSGKKGNFIRKIGFETEKIGDGSFSFIVCPFSLFYGFLMW